MELEYYTKAYEDLSTQVENLEDGLDNSIYTPEQVAEDVNRLFGETYTLCVNFEEDISLRTFSTPVGDQFQKLNNLFSRVIKLTQGDKVIDEPPKKKSKVSTYAEIRKLESPLDQNIRGKIDLANYKNDYQKSGYADQLSVLISEGYKSFYQVKGSGDCLYRSFYIQVLMKGLAEGKHSPTLATLLSLIELVESNDPQVIKDKEEIKAILNEAYETGEWLGKDNRVETLIEHVTGNREFDIGCVRLFRKITSDYLRKNKETFQEFFDGRPMDIICRQLEQLGEESEEMETVLLSQIFGLHVRLAHLNPEVEKGEFIESYGDTSKEASIHILHRPGSGHYDILTK